MGRYALSERALSAAPCWASRVDRQLRQLLGQPYRFPEGRPTASVSCSPRSSSKGCSS